MVDTQTAPQSVRNGATSERGSLPFVRRVLTATAIVSGVGLVLLFVWYTADLLMLVFAGVLVSILLHGLAATCDTSPVSDPPPLSRS